MAPYAVTGQLRWSAAGRATICKIHRYGFDTGEATLMGGGGDIVTLGEVRTAEETVTVDLDMAEVARICSELPVLCDRVLSIEAPGGR